MADRVGGREELRVGYVASEPLSPGLANLFPGGNIRLVIRGIPQEKRRTIAGCQGGFPRTTDLVVRRQGKQSLAEGLPADVRNRATDLAGKRQSVRDEPNGVENALDDGVFVRHPVLGDAEVRE